MAAKTLPYVPSYGQIKRALDRIKSAETPPRFTQDYLATTLDMPGGTAKPVIPFLKRTGFLGTDGAPTELYKRFRNSGQRGGAAAEALKTGYRPLYQKNEYVHNAKDADVKGLVVQVTGAEENSKVVAATVGSFKALKSFADFSVAAAASGAADETASGVNADAGGGAGVPQLAGESLNLAYTINLHLPATSDVAVFNAIFKSLREHLLKG